MTSIRPATGADMAAVADLWHEGWHAGDEVEQVFVGPEGRGTGLAALLLAEAERQVAAGGYAEAWLAVVAGNARARCGRSGCVQVIRSLEPTSTAPTRT